MKKHNRLITVLMAALLVCLVLAGCGAENVPAVQETDTPVKVEKDVTATNEQELRDYLAADTQQVVHISGEMTIREGFVINGNKTLTGDAKITMELAAELGQPMLFVSEGSSLTVDGPVLDCNYNADGVRVAENAQLNFLSGKILYAGAYGIQTYGDVTIEDISIEDCEYISICAQMGSSVDMKGGSVLRSAANDIYVVTGASVKIGGETLMEGALEHGMINYGTLEISGGKYGNVNNYLCDNYGELSVAYAGGEEDGKIEFYGCRNSVFLVRKGSAANIADVYIHDTSRQGISSLGGDLAIENCSLENTGKHSIDIQGGVASVTDVVITNSMGSGMEVINGAEVTVTNYTVNGCADIGIASRGAKVTATNVSITDAARYGLTCGTNTKGLMKVKDAVITNTGAHSLYVYDNARMELENVAVSDGAARGLLVAKSASCVISGESSFRRMAKGGVQVDNGTLTMNDVEISDNDSKGSGAGLYVANGASVTINNGSVHDNSSEVRGGGVCVSNAKLTVQGCKIYNNTAVNHGGGLYAQQGAIVTLHGGTVHNNNSENYGNGIYILNEETKVTISGYVYLGHNDVKVDNAKNYVTITRDGLSWHSETDPLYLTPNYNAPEGTVVATCKSAAAAKEILAASASGDGSYELAQDGKNIVIKYAVADMDMTGADTVEVSTFEQLKNAIETADTKRNIVLKSDITFTERIRFPGGVTINITDDGTQRTLRRADGFTDSLLVTHYGTGLYLTGTADNMLVVDGGGASTDSTKLQSLVRASGSTEIRNVVLKDNGSAAKEHDVRGALVRQLYGDVKIYDSVLTGGTAYSGGALMLDNAVGYVENCDFSGNNSTIGGGAIRVSAGCELDIVNSRVADNHSGSTGGGIVALGAGKVTATNTSFENNTAALYGGAVSAQDAGTQIKLIGTGGNAVIKNNSSETAGAIYAVKGSNVEIEGYTLSGNAATAGRAGAVSILDGSSATVFNSIFDGNTASASAGAMSVDGSVANLAGCTFTNNTAGDKGGAMVLSNHGQVTMNGNGTVSHNTASGTYGGGAVYVDETSVLRIAEHTLESNKAASGGAIYMAAGAKVEAENNLFVRNQATTGNGGAVYCAGAFVDSNSSYEENSAKRNGGAVIIMSGGNATMTGTDAAMKRNTAAVNNGGAVFVNGGGAATITGYALENNSKGAVQVQAKASANLKDVSLTGSGNGIYVNGNLSFDNLTGAHIHQTNAGAKITVNGFETGNVIALTPQYTPNAVVLIKGEASDAEFAAACEKITVAEGWYIENGVLKQIPAVSVVVNGSTKYYETLEEAVAFANTRDAATEIRLSENIYLGATVTVAKNVTIVNAPGKSVTITRGAELADDMFAVKGTLTIGSGITMDGAPGGNTDAAAVSGRIMTVYTGAALNLENNVILKNAKTSAAGAAVDVQVSGQVSINGAKFINNQTNSTGAAIRINAGATVTCQNAEFNGNKSWRGSTYSNGGAIYVAGTFTDTNSSYISNEGKNGAAIFLGAGTANVTLTGTNAKFQNNLSTGDKNSRGGAIFVNGGSVTVEGYTFEGNTSTGTNANTGNGAIHIVTGNAMLKNCVFQGTAAQNIYVQNNLVMENLTGANIVLVKDKTVAVTGTTAGTNIQLTPFSYSEDKAVLTGTADFSGIKVADGWYITGEGKLKQTTSIKIAVNGATEYFKSLDAAVAFANGQSGAVEIQLLSGTTLNATCEITGNVTISGNATITRDASLTGDMFVVNGSLTIGSGVTVDGGSVAVAGRSVTVNSGASFTLAAGAVLQNANSTNAGAAIHTSSANTYIYGTIRNNTVTGTTIGGAGLYVHDNAGATISGAVFSGNQCVASGSSAGAGAAILVRPGAIVTCQNARFENNTVPASKNGGAIYVAGTFNDTNSTYTGNVAKNGGAIFLGASTAKVTLTGTNENAKFENNQAKGATSSKGGALYNNGGTLTVDGYAFTGNTSQQSITAPTDLKNAQIWNASGTTTLTNITMN